MISYLGHGPRKKEDISRWISHMRPSMLFRGEHRKVYREVKLAYIVSDHQNLGNHTIYVLRMKLGHINDDVLEISVNKCRNHPMVDQGNEVWKM
jgi:hypothetical protein